MGTDTAPDWVLSADIKDAIVDFAVLNHQTGELEKAQKKLEEQIEGHNDVLAEFDLDGSWLQCGEAFILIESTDVAIESVTERQDLLEKERRDIAEEHARLEKIATQKRTMVEDKLGDKVRLRME